MEWSTDVDEAAWFLAELGGWGDRNVGCFVPSSLPAIGRLFHPAETDHETFLTWATVAAQHDRVAHPEMQFHAIATPNGEPVVWPLSGNPDLPWEGDLPKAEARVLAEVLSGFTTTPNDCFFGVWEGYGHLLGGGTSMHWRVATTGPFKSLRTGLNRLTAKRETTVGIAPPEIAGGPRVAIPQRDHLMLRGALGDLDLASSIIGDQTPNIWWPKDRAWFVASEIDYSWTYVAGSEEMLSAIVDSPHLEVLRAERHHRCTADADKINT